MGTDSGVLDAVLDTLGRCLWNVLLRRLPLISESDQLPDADTKERGLTEAEESAFRRCFVSQGTKPDDKIKARIEYRDDRVSLCVRPVSIPHFRKVLADRGLGENIILAGVLKLLESDCNKWVRFSHE